MSDFLTHLQGSYGWWMLALAFIALEVMLPGYFMLWIGVAAGAMGLVLLCIPTLDFLWQAILFSALAFLSCVGYWKWIRPFAESGDDKQVLNRRGETFIGQRYELVEAIVNGRGKARVADGVWMVEGPDLPVGTEIEVVGVDGALLKVKAAAAL